MVWSAATRWCKMTPRRLSIRRRWIPRLISLAVLAGVCAAVVPIPIAVPVVGQKDRSEPFPCQDHACGCLTAAQCWNHCCCMSGTAKVAWSRRHGVRPPDFVIASAERESAPRVSDLSSSGSGACCQKKSNGDESCGSKGCSTFKSRWAIGKAGASERGRAAKVAAGPAERSRQTLKAASSETRASKQTGRTFVLAALVLKCQGHSNYWHSLPWSVIAPRFEVPQRVMPIEATCEVECVRIPHVTLQPPAPPPRGAYRSAA